MTFSNRTVLVTGAAGNLGRIVADAFAARGANLVLVDLRPESLERAFGAEDDRRLLAPANLLDQEQVHAAVK
ncbi:MAG: SDR family NAD(P)-dependent oxidoreductase, partial [Burkholderiales bacterium]